MSTGEQNVSAHGAFIPASSPVTVSAIIPARNEEAVIATCIQSLAGQPEIAEILGVNDQSTAGTAAVVRGLMEKIPNLRLIDSGALPPGLVGKKHALFAGAHTAQAPLLLLTAAL